VAGGVFLSLLIHRVFPHRQYDSKDSSRAISLRLDEPIKEFNKKDTGRALFELHPIEEFGLAVEVKHPTLKC
jgi:hypothetical protein